MPSRQRMSSGAAQQLVPLLLLAIGLVTTNNSVTFLDDEALALGAAAHPLRTILAQAVSGTGAAASHPLYGVILRFWLRATDGNFDYLRIPSILFFLAGLFLLGRAAKRFTSASGGAAVLWAGALWPFSFHYARLAIWYSFSFFLVAGLTLMYLEYLEDQSRDRWTIFLAFSAGLIWTTGWGWTILACLALDQILRARAKEPAASVKAVLGTAALLCLLFLPFFPALRAEIFSGANLHQRPLTIFANAGLSLYSLFVSESVAPWFWRFSIPAALAILVCIALVARWSPHSARRFLIYSGLILAALALTGTLQTKNLLMISPWILLPAGVAIEAVKPRWATFGLAAALLVIGGVGWYGIYSRRFYSDLRWVEPWQEVAGEAVTKIGGGATVIADQPAFLLYLTYMLHVPRVNGPWNFEGLLPDDVAHPQVFSPQRWLAAAHPTSGKSLLIRGGNEAGLDPPMDNVAHQLDQSCGSISSRLRVRDSGNSWKQRFLPESHPSLWRIEIREYDCDESSSKQIYRIPQQ